jgi:hypothetical protein
MPMTCSSSATVAKGGDRVDQFDGLLLFDADHHEQALE